MIDHNNSDLTRVDRQTAEAEFDRFADAISLKIHHKRVEDAVKEDREKFIEGVMDGLIVVDNEGLASVMTKDDDLPEVKFPREIGMMAMSAAERGANGGERMIQMVSAATGIASGRIRNCCDGKWWIMRRFDTVLNLFLEV
jgi:hypothetical protein